MKRLKIIYCIIILLCVVTFGFLSIKKTNALTSLYVQEFTISERSQDSYGFVGIYDLSSVSTNQQNNSFEFFILRGYNYNWQYYLTVNNSTKVMRLLGRDTPSAEILESVSLTGICFLELLVDYDATGLFLVAYNVVPTYQHDRGVSPSVDGFIRTLLFRHDLSSNYDLTTDWQNHDIYVCPCYNQGVYTYNGLLNGSYIDATDSLSSVNTWVDNQILNAYLFQSVINSSYQYGYDDGDYFGYQRGASDGYDDGYSDGESDGYTFGFRDGQIDGYHEGYDIGYTDGQNGENAVSPTFNILTGIFTAIGSIMSIELAPHVPLGLFILIPLFFSALGLILWIWRRN